MHTEDGNMKSPSDNQPPQKHKPHGFLNISERRELLSQAVEMVANAAAPSLVVFGQAGTGKTHQVKDTLRALGLVAG